MFWQSLFIAAVCNLGGVFTESLMTTQFKLLGQVHNAASAKRLQMMAEENFKSISEVAGPVNMAKETLSQVLTTHFLAERKPNEDDKGDDEDDAEDKNDKADDEFYEDDD